MTQLCYITKPDGERYWVGTQGEAKKETKEGGSWEVIDIPSGKQDLLDFMNEREGSQAPTVAETPVTPSAPKLSGDRCPMCSRTKQAAAKLAEGLDVDMMEEKIEKSDGWVVARLADAVIRRLEKLKS